MYGAESGAEGASAATGASATAGASAEVGSSSGGVLKLDDVSADVVDEVEVVDEDTAVVGVGAGVLLSVPQAVRPSVSSAAPVREMNLFMWFSNLEVVPDGGNR